MITCPYCRKSIPENSWFCDQCGEALKFCPECNTPKKGVDCPACGEHLVDAEIYYCQNKSSKFDKYSDPKLFLSGMGLHLEIVSGDFGRVGGVFPEFSNLQYVSRKHGAFKQKDNSWYLIDHGSTNGTQLNGQPLEPNKMYKVTTGDKILLAKHNHFIVE